MTLAVPVTVDLTDDQIVFSFFCSNNSLFSSRRMARSTKAFSAALASYWNRCLLGELRAVSCSNLVRRCVRLSQVTGVRVISWCETSSVFTLAIWGTVSSASGFWILPRTLSISNRYSPALHRPDLMFRGVNAEVRTRLYSKVKCCLPTMFAPPLCNRSTFPTKRGLPHQAWCTPQVAHPTKRGLPHQVWYTPQVAHPTKRGLPHQVWCTPQVAHPTRRGLPHQVWYTPQVAHPTKRGLPHRAYTTSGPFFPGALGSQAASPRRYKLHGEERSIGFSPEREALQTEDVPESLPPGYPVRPYSSSPIICGLLYDNLSVSRIHGLRVFISAKDLFGFK